MIGTGGPSSDGRRTILYPEDDDMILAALEDYHMGLKDSNEIARCEMLIRIWKRVVHGKHQVQNYRS